MAKEKAHMLMPGFSAELSLFCTGPYNNLRGPVRQHARDTIEPAYVDPACFDSCYNNCNQGCFGLIGMPRSACLRDCKQTEQACRATCTVAGPPPVPPSPPGNCLYGNWCGPGCGSGPVLDVLDSCCHDHDICYDLRGWGACSCDREFINCVFPIGYGPTALTAMGGVARVFGAIFTGKLLLNGCPPDSGGPPPPPGCCPPGRSCCGSCASGKCDDICIGPGQSCR